MTATFKLWESRARWWHRGPRGDYRWTSRATWRVWLCIRLGSCWIGAHWSAGNRRLCVNVLPFWTIAIVFPRGIDPN
jgi:hypothetical protein